MSDRDEFGCHIGILRINAEVLCAALGLPSGTEVLGVQVPFDVNGSIVELKVGHPDLPYVRVGNVIPVVSAEVRAGAGPLEFVRWRQ